MSGTTLLLNIAYIILVTATFFRTVLKLRIGLIVAALGFITYGIVSGTASIAIWNSVTGSLHLFQVMKHLRARRAVEISVEDELLRKKWFPELDRFDFFSIWSLGESVLVANSQLTTEGDHPDAVSLVIEGVVEVRSSGTKLGVVEPGALLGEMSFLSGDGATADAYAVGAVRLRRWPNERLTALQHLNPEAAKAFHAFISLDLRRKLLSWRQ